MKELQKLSNGIYDRKSSDVLLSYVTISFNVADDTRAMSFVKEFIDNQRIIYNEIAEGEGTVIPKDDKGNYKQITCTEEVKSKTENKEHQMSDKLILDQPDTITNKGKIEHMVGDNTMKPLNDSSNPAKQNQDVLLTENPLDGVAIIKG